MPAENASPERRTRPKERKEQILASATKLFVQHGFPNVTMSAIAESVDITAGGLYRHYPNKSELLASSIRQNLDSFPRFDPASPLDEALTLACDAAVRHREVGTLWSRELRYLPDDAQAELRAQVKDMDAAYIDLVKHNRPGLTHDQACLLARAVQSVLTSPGSHSVVMPAAEFSNLLKAACRSLCAADLVSTSGTVFRPSPALEPVSRRELLLQNAIRLFGSKGVYATSMEDIGAAVGVTGPSLYTHFSGKDEILSAALDRASQALWLDLGEALHHHSDPGAALQAVVSGYVRMTRGWLHLASLVFVDTVVATAAFRARQREYVSEWVALIRSCEPEIEQSAARVLTHAALAVIHDASRTIEVSEDTSISTNLTAIAMLVLNCAK